MRSAFRKEHKIVIKSQVSGAGAEEMYAPRLWYYNQLLFLCDQEAHSSTSSMQQQQQQQHDDGDGGGFTYLACGDSNFDTVKVTYIMCAKLTLLLILQGRVVLNVFRKLKFPT